MLPVKYAALGSSSFKLERWCVRTNYMANKSKYYGLHVNLNDIGHVKINNMHPIICRIILDNLSSNL